MLTAAVLAGCGTEVGRVNCRQGELLSGAVTIAANEPAALWTDFDAEYVDGTAFRYSITVETPDGKALTACTADPTNVNTRINSRMTDAGRHHTRRYLGKLDCETFEIADGGPVKIEGTFEVEGEEFTLDRCDVVVRQ